MTNFFGHSKAMRKIIKSVQLGTNELGSERHNGLPLLKMGNLTRGSFNFNKLEFIQEGNPKLNEQYILNRGDFLFNTRNTLELVGKSAVWKDGLPNAIFNNNIMRIIFINDISSFYLSYYFEHDIGWSKLKRIATGTTSVAAIYTRDLYNVEVILPSYSEQKKIVEVLMTVDNSLEKTEALIEKYKNIKQGMMQDLLTKGIDEHGNIRSEKTDEFKDSPIGRIPKEWEYETIDRLTCFVGSGVTPTGGDEVYDHEGIIFIRSQNVYAEGLKLDDVAYINSDINKRMERSQVYASDVLLNITGASIGRCCYVPLNFPLANVNQHVCIIRLSDVKFEDAIYLSFVLNSDIGQKQIRCLNAGGNREGLNYQQIRRMVIPWPQEEERKKIADKLLQIQSKIATEEKLQKKFQQLKQGLMHDLLTGKVRVSLEEATG